MELISLRSELELSRVVFHKRCHHPKRRCIVKSDACGGRRVFTEITASAEVKAFLLIALRRAVVKEVSWCLYWTSRPHLPSTNHVNAEIYRALRIVTTFGQRMVMRYGAQFWPLPASNHIYGNGL